MQFFWGGFSGAKARSIVRHFLVGIRSALFALVILRGCLPPLCPLCVCACLFLSLFFFSFPFHSPPSRFMLLFSFCLSKRISWHRLHVFFFSSSVSFCKFCRNAVLVYLILCKVLLEKNGNKNLFILKFNF